ncbi:MAG: 50S ribosomal protein L11 [Candidatus Marsarchaeota archaeon]|nr:50S ribosomal protein L11 [Candidatus Marsarchaeota archaeon]
MGKVKVLKFMVPAGKANPGPPIGPALGPTGVKTPQVVQKINEATKKYSGMNVNVNVKIDVETKDFEVEVLQPSVSSLIMNNVGAEKGPGTPHTTKIGNISIADVVAIAKERMPTMNTPSLKSAVKTILSVCRTIGVTVDNEDPKLVISKVASGELDAQIV